MKVSELIEKLILLDCEKEIGIENISSDWNSEGEIDIEETGLNKGKFDYTLHIK